MKDKSLVQLRMLLALAVAAMLAACASIGRPEGGPRDEEPPVFVASNPMPGTLNFNGRRVTVIFNENVSLDDPTNKIVVSPPQKNQPRISSGGRRVTIELQDTLLPDATYTIDFADAVKDLNEGNVLDGFSIDFATGDVLDTLSISGMVLEARNLEPAQGMIVGVYNADGFTDTTLTTRRLERITKTNQLGQFTVRNLAPGNYRIFALNDLNRDFHWDRSEDVAFYDVELTPWTEAAVFTDTVADSSGRDSVVTRPGTRFLPDNVLLTWFNENYSPRYLVKNERPDRRQMQLMFSAQADSLPQIAIAEGPLAGQPIERFAVVEASARLDSLTYWITDTMLSALDTIRISARYQYTDSLDRMSWRTDTLPMILRGAKKKLNKKKAEAQADSAAAAPAMEFVSFSPLGGSAQELNRGLTFRSETPLARIDSAGVRMERMVDTLWVAVPPPRLALRDSLNLREVTAPYEWLPAMRYKLTIDSAAVTDVFGNHTKAISHEFTTKSREDYSALYFAVKGVPDSVAAYVELLQNDDPKRVAKVENGVASLEYLAPGTYYARLFIDADGNGEWTTGSVNSARQPEEVSYFPKKLNLKKNWDVEQTWDIYLTPVDLQKPNDIKKNKPKKRGNEKDTADDREDDDEEEMWGGSQMNDPFFRNPAADRRR